MSMEQRVRRLEDDVNALKTGSVLFDQRLDSIDRSLDTVNESVKTGWTQANDTFKEQIAQLREDRQSELNVAAEERKAMREESRWWWTKAFGIATTVLGIVGAIAGGTYYSMPHPTAEPAIIVQPHESIP
jgi:hypothetical protein